MRITKYLNFLHQRTWSHGYLPHNSVKLTDRHSCFQKSGVVMLSASSMLRWNTLKSKFTNLAPQVDMVVLSSSLAVSRSAILRGSTVHLYWKSAAPECKSCLLTSSLWCWILQTIIARATPFQRSDNTSFLSMKHVMLVCSFLPGMPWANLPCFYQMSILRLLYVLGAWWEVCSQKVAPVSMAETDPTVTQEC